MLIGGRSSGPAPASPTSDDFTCSIAVARRDTARLLRAMQASGRGVSTWPHDVVTRLAHLDCVTARHLMDRAASQRLEVESARRELLQLRRWLWDGLGPGERAEVQRYQLQVRIEESELHLPLLSPDQAPQTVDGSVADYTLVAGIRGVSDEQLARMMQRLGLRVHGDVSDRAATESHLLHLLGDDQMVGVLVATLDDDSLELLAALVRGEVDDRSRQALAAVDPVALAVGADTVDAPLEAAGCLRDCGLAFARCPNHGRRLWVPVEMQHRLDGVLRVFGL
ncbi:MAG: hypothetical protein AAF721_27470 [Myxococcota bacterium]